MSDAGTSCCQTLRGPINANHVSAIGYSTGAAGSQSKTSFNRQSEM